MQKLSIIDLLGRNRVDFFTNFMCLISAIEEEFDPSPARLKLHVLAFATWSLRNAVSLFSRFNVKEDELDKLEACNDFYSCCALFLQVNTTVWTFGGVVPVHARDIFAK